ncbi:glycosyltransferase [Ketobacter sp.]|uniref:glycosyltransferase n=1 Tax=Ketobacter sp. TaxID=2083498 RepID=UPI000F2BADAA|nr:glycosyltransferase [Ketobacter sp.]RLU01213.1 MAG: glycosyltransferase [Ketobacter sp.]
MMIPFNVIVPVRNEEVQLQSTAPALKASLTGLPVTVTYVLNATTDASRAVIESVFGHTACIIELPHAGKANALRAADASVRGNLIVYLDADIVVTKDTFPALLHPLIEGHADFVAARLVVDLSQSLGFALRVGRVWGDQLARRPDAFMCCTAINENGLKQRGPWPDVLADDDWARNRIDPSRRMIIEAAKAYMTPPLNLLSWVKVRARWICGTRQLKNMGENFNPGEKIMPRGSVIDLAAYYIVRLSAELLALIWQHRQSYWSRDNSSRRKNCV